MSDQCCGDESRTGIQPQIDGISASTEVLLSSLLRFLGGWQLGIAGMVWQQESAAGKRQEHVRAIVQDGEQHPVTKKISASVGRMGTRGRPFHALVQFETTFN